MLAILSIYRDISLLGFSIIWCTLKCYPNLKCSCFFPFLKYLFNTIEFIFGCPVMKSVINLNTLRQRIWEAGRLWVNAIHSIYRLSTAFRTYLHLLILLLRLMLALWQSRTYAASNVYIPLDDASSCAVMSYWQLWCQI